jgi:hypothetical protein
MAQDILLNRFLEIKVILFESFDWKMKYAMDLHMNAKQKSSSWQRETRRKRGTVFT